MVLAEHVRWGVLGNANIARKALLPAIQDAINAKTVAIASTSGRTKETAKQFCIEKSYNGYEALLNDPDIDAVYIPLPNGLHAEWGIKAAEAGKHVLCEKPAALAADEAAKMIKACRKHHVLFMEAFMYQFHPQHDVVKKMEHFSACILNGTKPQYSGESTIQNMKAIDGCYESINSGQAVWLK
jgi:xylose dehydrogenase (NAD/NADP)